MPDEPSSSSSNNDNEGEDGASSSSSSSETEGTPGSQAVFNQRQLEVLEDAEKIAEMAGRESYRTVLAERAEITTAVVAHLEDLCGRARIKAAEAVQKDVREAVSGELDETRQERVKEIIHRLQSAAKQKYARRDPRQLGNYFVGERVDATQALLHQVAFALALLLTPPTGVDLATAKDRLPGVTLAEINELRELIGLPLAPLAESSSSSASGESPDSGEEDENDPDRAMRDALIEEIADRKMEIQFAVEGLYPHTDPLNIDARRDFLLPGNRPFSG